MYFDPIFKDWLEVDFPISYIYDFSNYGFLTGLLYIFIKFSKTVKENKFALYSILMLSPFFFHGLTTSLSLFPDQIKYLGAARDFRESVFDLNKTFHTFSIYGIGRLKITLPAYFYNLFPTTNFETYRSIGFINRFLYILMIILLTQKKNISLSVKLFLILSPSLTLYSSISLRETLILLLMVFLFYNLLKKNYLSIIISLVLLFFIKVQNLIIVIMPLFLYWIYERKLNYIATTIIILSTCLSIFFIFEDAIFDLINKISRGFFSEQNGSYRGIFIMELFDNYNLDNFMNKIFSGMFDIIISPLPNINSVSIAVILFENLFIYLLIFLNLFFRFSKKNKLEKKIAIYWLITLIFSLAYYSIISFNDGTVHRYKIIILSFVLIGFNIHVANKKHLIKSSSANY